MNVTDAAGAFALSETKTRPVAVAAQSVPVLAGARLIAEMLPAARSAAVRRTRQVGRAGGPIRTKSPQFGGLEAVVNSGQFASRNAWLPPQSWVRQTLCEPWKIEPA